MKIEISELIAKYLQRIICVEIEKQKRMYQKDLDQGIELWVLDTSLRIIQELDELADQLEKQGIRKYIK